MGIGEHRDEAFPGMSGVEDEIHFAGFERAEDGGDERCAVVQEQGDGRGCRAGVIEDFARDKMGAAVEFGVGPVGSGRADGDAGGELRGDAGETGGDGLWI